jgi:hypothetical protein
MEAGQPTKTDKRMPKGILALLVLAMTGGLLILAGLFTGSHHAPAEPPQVSFTGTEPGTGNSYLAAGFYITNSGRQAILLQQVQVQTAVDGVWTTLSEKQPEFSRVLEPGAKEINLLPFLEAGERRKMIVEWPDERPWRLCLIYAHERKGISALTAKSRFAWQTRSMRYWRGRVWGGADQVYSQEVMK